MEKKIYLTIEEGMGTDGQYYCNAEVCRSAQEAGESASSLMATMAQEMGVYTEDFDPTATWEIKGDGWWYKVRWADAGPDPHSPSLYLMETAKKLYSKTKKDFACEKDTACFAEQASIFIKQFMEEFLPEGLEKNCISDEEKNELNILFGADAVNIYVERSDKSDGSVEDAIKADGLYEYKEKRFDTEAERSAYIDGLQDGSGWGEYVFTEKLNFL